MCQGRSSKRADQLPEAGDPEAGIDVCGVLTIAFGFALVDDSAALRGGHADHHVELVLVRELAPAIDDMTIVLGRRGQPRRIVDAVVVEKDPENFVSLFQGCLREEVRRV